MSLQQASHLLPPAVGKEKAYGASTRSKKRMVKIFCVEGGIGVGKTTILESLRDKYDHVHSVTFVPEPVDTWMEHGLLQNMYAGGHLGQFQHMVLSTLVSPLLCALLNPSVETIVTERSPWSNHSIFASSNLRGIDMTSFNLTYHNLLKPLSMAADLHVCLLVLTAPVEVAMERIETRGRECEKNIDVSYMRSLHESHEKMKTDPPALFLDAYGNPLDSNTVSVQEIDATLPPESVALQLSEFIF